MRIAFFHHVFVLEWTKKKDNPILTFDKQLKHLTAQWKILIRSSARRINLLVTERRGYWGERLLKRNGAQVFGQNAVHVVIRNVFLNCCVFRSCWNVNKLNRNKKVKLRQTRSVSVQMMLNISSYTSASYKYSSPWWLVDRKPCINHLPSAVIAPCQTSYVFLTFLQWLFKQCRWYLAFII